MRSIRLSLMGYFFLLLALALGAVSVIVYQTSRSALQDKEAKARELIDARFDERARAVQEELDDRMLRRAQTLANLAKSQWSPPAHMELLALAAGPAGVSTHGHIAVWLSVVPATDDTMAHRLFGYLGLKIQFEDVLPPDRADASKEYFQVFNEVGVPLQHSRSLGEKSPALDAAVLAKLTRFGDHFTYTTELRPGEPVRWVTLKAPVTKFQVDRPPPGDRRPPGRPPGLPPDGQRKLRRLVALLTPGPALASAARLWALQPPVPVEMRRLVALLTPDTAISAGVRTAALQQRRTRPRFWPREVRTSPAIFISCGYDVGLAAPALEKLASQRDDDKAALARQTGATLDQLNRHLLWICAGAFAAILLGGVWLVRQGLAPLQRLSDAVSRVSEKNFQLDVERDRLPVELRPIAERLTKSLEQLQRAFEREKQAAADLSHELRTPVAALLTTIEVGLRKPRSPAEYRELLEECRGSSQTISQLVERLLALARLDAGVDTMRPQQVDAADLAEQCVAVVRPLAEARGLKLRLHRNGPAVLSADPVKLREVFTNLLHNAIEYNRPQGSVDLSVERHNGSLRVRVQDTGVGISPEARQHIFERFYRADPSRQAEGLHAGLGLAIVKGYVEMMGGSIGVDSRVGEGSTFSVELPVA
jgi:signal transduction histidine kinase